MSYSEGEKTSSDLFYTNYVQTLAWIILKRGATCITDKIVYNGSNTSIVPKVEI